MSGIPLRLSVMAVVCVSAGACLRSQEVAPKYDYGASAPPRKEGEEVVVARPARRYRPEDTFAKLDEDGDGALSVAEFVAQRRAPVLIQQATDIFGFSDQNGDGKLSLEEFKTKPPRARFRQMDVDGDGGLSIREFYEGEMASGAIEQARRVFDLVDRDDDDAVSFEEYQDRTQEARLAKMDEDLDERLSLQEFENAHKDLTQSGRSQPAFAAMDRNGDGLLTGQEYVRRPQEAHFIFRDKDNDHKLSLEEFGFGRWDQDSASLQSDFQTKDTDGDGLLTVREFTYASADEDFWAMDRDNDARVGWEELAGLGSPATTTEPTDDRLRGLFGEIDQNGDQLVCLEEFRARRNDLTFYCRDADRNRRLSTEEFKQGFDATPEAIAEAEKIFQFKDQDGDAKLTFEEYKSNPADLKYWRMDADGDGALSFEEYHQGEMPLATVERARRVFGALDGNDDARVSFEEWGATSQEIRHARIDENADERLSLEEFEKAHKDLVAGGRSQPAFTVMDRDGDGELTVEEFVKRPQEADFLFRDQDNDHKLSLEEFGLWKRNQDPASIQTAYEKKDTDADGLLTLREYTYAPADEDFWAMDRDNDARVGWEELAGAGSPAAAAEPTDDRLRGLFAEIDRNGDQLVCLEEFRARRNDLAFYCRDADRDRRLSAEEFKEGFDDTPEAVAEAEKIFIAKDQDGDAKLTFHEFNATPAKMRYWRMDADGDGFLNPEEFHQGDMASASVERARAVFEVMDQDKDGKLNAGEFRSRPSEAWFLRSDADEDGYCSFDEYVAVNGGPVRKRFCLACFTPIDRNGDGILSKEEFCQQSQEAQFHKRDQNSDGTLTVDEYAAWAPTPEKTAEARADFERKDTNGDGRLDLREHLYRAAENDFWAADKNGDLVVGLDEFRKRMLVEGDEGAGAKLEEIFNRIDQNGDGKVSVAEFGWQPEETRFQWFDLNQDGRLTQEEFVGNLEEAGAIKRAQNAFADRDKDGNGSLSPEEFIGGGN